MSKVNYAAIDIGSNAVRLLIKSINPETAEQLFTKELLLRVPLRLGEEVFTQGEIPASKAKKLLRLMKAYRQLMKIYEVDAYRACATSAMRDAANGKEVIETITRKSGIRIDIINGEEEARLVYDNHIEYLADKNADYIYVDVGGGSTEISLIHQGILRSSRSYNQKPLYHSLQKNAMGFTKLFSKTTGRNNISPPEKIPIIVSLFPIFEFSGLTTCKISRSIV